MPSGRKGEDSQVGKVQRFNIEDEDFYSKIFLQVIDRVVNSWSKELQNKLILQQIWIERVWYIRSKLIFGQHSAIICLENLCGHG
jgi:hypothetical protein